MQESNNYPVLPKDVFENWRLQTDEEKNEEGDWVDFVTRVGISIDPHRNLASNYFVEGVYGLRRKDNGNIILVVTFYDGASEKVENGIKLLHDDKRIKRAGDFTWKIYKSIPEISSVYRINQRDNVLVVEAPLKGPEMNDFAKFVFSFETSWEQRHDQDGRYMVAFDCKYDGRFPCYGEISKKRLDDFMAEVCGCDEFNKGMKRFWKDYNHQKKTSA